MNFLHELWCEISLKAEFKLKISQYEISCESEEETMAENQGFCLKIDMTDWVVIFAYLRGWWLSKENILCILV